MSADGYVAIAIAVLLSWVAVGILVGTNAYVRGLRDGAKWHALIAERLRRYVK